MIVEDVGECIRSWIFVGGSARNKCNSRVKVVHTIRDFANVTAMFQKDTGITDIYNYSTEKGEMLLDVCKAAGACWSSHLICKFAIHAQIVYALGAWQRLHIALILFPIPFNFHVTLTPIKKYQPNNFARLFPFRISSQARSNIAMLHT